MFNPFDKKGLPSLASSHPVNTRTECECCLLAPRGLGSPGYTGLLLCYLRLDVTDDVLELVDLLDEEIHVSPCGREVSDMRHFAVDVKLDVGARG